MLSTDANLFLALNSLLSGPLATPLFRAATTLGNGLVLALLVLLPMYRWDRDRFRQHALALVVAVAVSGLVVNLMKIAVDRPRPPAHFAGQNLDIDTPAGLPPDPSFPSGHTQTAFGTATYLACLYPKYGAPLIVLAAIVGLSRIALGVHFPLDVLIGALIGAAFSFAVARNRLARLRR